jgi:hypothetical protein
MLMEEPSLPGTSALQTASCANTGPSSSSGRPTPCMTNCGLPSTVDLWTITPPPCLPVHAEPRTVPPPHVCVRRISEQLPFFVSRSIMDHEASVRPENGRPEQANIHADKPASNPDTCPTRNGLSRIRNVYRLEAVSPCADEETARSGPDINITAAHRASDGRPPIRMDVMRAVSEQNAESGSPGRTPPGAGDSTGT